MSAEFGSMSRPASTSAVHAARRGRPVTNATLCKIAAALRGAPVVPGVDDLLEPWPETLV
jgi:hypothetical protein